MASIGDLLNKNANSKPMYQIAMERYPEYEPGYDPSTMGFAGSGWEGMLRQNLMLQNAMNTEKGAQKSASSAAQARSSLASRGGLTSGARERIAENQMKNYMDMSQGFAREGLEGEFNIATLKNQLREKDIGNSISENARKNDYSMRAYEAQMEALAAEKQAQATQESSGKK